jgi:hypothetical protein
MKDEQNSRHSLPDGSNQSYYRYKREMMRCQLLVIHYQEAATFLSSL